MSSLPGFLFVVPWTLTPVGGVDQVVLNLYRKVEAAGDYAPQILVTSWPHSRPKTTTEDGRSVTYMRVREPIAPAARWTSGVKWAVALIPELRRIARHVRENNIAAVNVHFPSPAALQFVLVRALFRLRFRIILSFHGKDLAAAASAVSMERRIWGYLFRQADALVACSTSLRDSIGRFDSAAHRRFTTIHNGVDIDHLMQSRNAAAVIDSRLDGRPFIVSVAAYERRKGLDTLLRAFRSIRDKPGAESLLALVGTESGAGDELRELADHLGLSDHVVFCGEIPHSDLWAYYENAKVFCLASRAEPFGLVLLEAGAFRCPVVATSIGGIPEILADGVNAYLAPPDDPAALADRLVALLGNPDECSRLAGALFEHVNTRFTWAAAHDAYMKLARLG